MIRISSYCSSSSSAPALRKQVRPVWLCMLLLLSLSITSCNKAFQPEVNYTPKLNVFAILFGDSHKAYVRVMSVVDNPLDVSRPVHGAVVTLSGGPSGSPISCTLVDTTQVIDGDTASFYFTDADIVPGASYMVSVTKDGYPPVNATATVPFGYAAIPDLSAYASFMDPDSTMSDVNVDVHLSGLASAAFVQMLVEYRAIDSLGKFHVGTFDVIPVDSLNPFTEIQALVLRVNVNMYNYWQAFDLARRSATGFDAYHLYVDIIVTQIDDNLYRFFMTSTRSLNPLSMRTDKIIFTNIPNNAGTGIVSGASSDTTRIFLF